MLFGFLHEQIPREYSISFPVFRKTLDEEDDSIVFNDKTVKAFLKRPDRSYDIL